MEAAIHVNIVGEVDKYRHKRAPSQFFSGFSDEGRADKKIHFVRNHCNIIFPSFGEEVDPEFLPAAAMATWPLNTQLKSFFKR